MPLVKRKQLRFPSTGDFLRWMSHAPCRQGLVHLSLRLLALFGPSYHCCSSGTSGASNSSGRADTTKWGVGLTFLDDFAGHLFGRLAIGETLEKDLLGDPLGIGNLLLPKGLVFPFLQTKRFLSLFAHKRKRVERVA